MSKHYLQLAASVALLIVTTPLYAQTCVVAFPEQNGSWATVEENQFGGPLINSADQIFAAAKMEVAHHPVEPWADVLKKFENGQIDILAIALRSAEREKTMKFVGPWLSYHWGPFTLAHTNPNDLKHPTIGVNRALKNVQPIPTYLTRLHGNPDWDTPANLVNKLSSGKIDIILGEREVINRQASINGLQVKELPGTDMRMTAYMAINPSSACMKHAETLDRAIRDWKKDGGHDQLIMAVAELN